LDSLLPIEDNEVVVWGDYEEFRSGWEWFYVKNWGFKLLFHYVLDIDKLSFYKSVLVESSKDIEISIISSSCEIVPFCLDCNSKNMARVKHFQIKQFHLFFDPCNFYCLIVTHWNHNSFAKMCYCSDTICMNLHYRN